MDPFVIGCNYWPAASAMSWWEAFDAEQVRTDFARMADWDFNLVRIFLRWESFQPDPQTVAHLDDLEAVMDVALAQGLRVMPTFLVGNMSGLCWWPAWALSHKTSEKGTPRWAGGALTDHLGRDPYRDKDLLAAQITLASAVAQRIGGHPALWGWDLANEPDLFYQPTSYGAVASWWRLLAGTLLARSQRPLTLGLHLGNLTEPGSRFRPDLLAMPSGPQGEVPGVTVQSIHAYPVFYPPTEYDDPLCSDVVPLACMVTEALGGCPVLCQEFGLPTDPHGSGGYFKWVRRGPEFNWQYFASEVNAAQYYWEVTEKLLRCGAVGVLAWNYADYDPALYRQPPFDVTEHERYFGLVSADGTLKSQGLIMADLAKRLRTKGVPKRTIGPLRLDPEDWYADPAGNFARLLAEWKGKL